MRAYSYNNYKVCLHGFLYEENDGQRKKYRAEGSAGGTGLGLYISRQFARTMGGDLVLEKSALGVGTSFSFTLSLAVKEKDEN